jgi:hypothetical protein
MNISLLCKWRWLLESEEGLWQNIVKIKYGRGSPICLIIYKGVEELRSTMGIGLVSGLMLGWWTFFVSSCNTLCYGNFNESHKQITRACYEPKSKGGIQKQSFRFKLS